MKNQDSLKIRIDQALLELGYLPVDGALKELLLPLAGKKITIAVEGNKPCECRLNAKATFLRGKGLREAVKKTGASNFAAALVEDATLLLTPDAPACPAGAGAGKAPEGNRDVRVPGREAEGPPAAEKVRPGDRNRASFRLPEKKTPRPVDGPPRGSKTKKLEKDAGRPDRPANQARRRAGAGEAGESLSDLIDRITTELEKRRPRRRVAEGGTVPPPEPVQQPNKRSGLPEPVQQLSKKSEPPEPAQRLPERNGPPAQTGEAETAGNPAGPERREDTPLLLKIPPPKVTFFPKEDVAVIKLAESGTASPASDLYLHRQALAMLLSPGFDTLLSINAARDIQLLDYQLATVRHVLKNLRGRALLCDEVGMGKTIEAGLIALEYIMRGLVRRVLVLAPPSLVEQWRLEMQARFNLDFVTYDAPAFKSDPQPWTSFPRIIASIDTACSVPSSCITRWPAPWNPRYAPFAASPPSG